MILKKTANISRTEYKQVLPWNYTIEWEVQQFYHRK